MSVLIEETELSKNLAHLVDFYKSLKDGESAKPTSRQEVVTLNKQKVAVDAVQKFLIDFILEKLSADKSDSAETTAEDIEDQINRLETLLKTPQLDINTLLEQIVVLKTLFTAFTYKCDFVEDKQVEFLTSYFLPLYYNLGLEFESSKSNFSKEIKDLKRSHQSELRIQKDLLSNEFVKVGTLETTIVGLEAKSTDLEQELALIQQALVDSENQTQHLRHEVEELKKEAERLEKDLDSCFSETRELDSINQQDTSRHTKRILELKEDIKRQQDVIKIQEEELLNQSSFRENQQDTIADLLDTTTSLKHQLALVVRQPQSPESPRLNRTYSLSEIDRRTRMANDGQMVATLKELFSREERKLIPLFSGDVDDRNVMDWLREAEASTAKLNTAAWSG